MVYHFSEDLDGELVEKVREKNHVLLRSRGRGSRRQPDGVQGKSAGLLRSRWRGSARERGPVRARGQKQARQAGAGLPLTGEVFAFTVRLPLPLPVTTF